MVPARIMLVGLDLLQSGKPTRGIGNVKSSRLVPVNLEALEAVHVAGAAALQLGLDAVRQHGQFARDPHQDSAVAWLARQPPLDHQFKTLVLFLGTEISPPGSPRQIRLSSNTLQTSSILAQCRAAPPGFGSQTAWLRRKSESRKGPAASSIPNVPLIEFDTIFCNLGGIGPDSNWHHAGRRRDITRGPCNRG